MTSREELGLLITELVSLVFDERRGEDDSLERQLVEIINQKSPDPHWYDYIFQSDEFVHEDGSVALQSLLDRIYQDKAIYL